MSRTSKQPATTSRIVRKTTRAPKALRVIDGGGRKTVQGPHAEFATDGFDDSGFADPPSYDAVLAVRAERVAMVTAFLADLDDADLEGPAVHVWAPDVPRRVVQSVHTILAEEWEHLRYALRDLAVVEGSSSA